MKMDIVCFVGLFGLITGCGSPVRPPLTAEASAQQALIVNAEAKAQPPARQALSTLRQMVNRGEIIPGAIKTGIQIIPTAAGDNFATIHHLPQR